MIEEFLKSNKLQELYQALQTQKSVLIENLWNAPKALITALAQQATGKHILLLTGASQEEIRLYHDFAFFSDKPVVEFPAWETLPQEQIAPSPDIVGERYTVLRKIAAGDRSYVILTSLQACLQRVIPPQHFHKLSLTLSVEDTYPFEALIQKLTEMGYKRQITASDKGEFAVRGGIIDIFPVSTPDPYRVEFWGDEVTSLRTFDPIGQKSVQPVKRIDITPAQEMELLTKESKLSTILDYLGPQTLIVFDDLLALEDRYATLIHTGGTPTSSFSSIDTFLDQIDPLQKIFWSQQSIEELSEVRRLGSEKGNFYSESAPMQPLSFQMFNRDLTALQWRPPFVPVSQYLLPDASEEQEITTDELLLALGHLSKTNCHLHILCESETEEVRFMEKIHHAHLSLPRHTTFHRHYLSCGFVLADIHLVLLSLTEFTHRYKIRRQKQRSTYHIAPSEVYDLSPGEMIVHLNHGIGRYLGTEKRPDHNGIPTDFYQIEYADNAKLYVPIQQAYLISKYIGSNEEIPRMHTLGSSRWKKTREHTEHAINGYAKELLQFYAQRSIREGFVYPQDSPDFKAFEEEFPYVETEDQLAAIADIKKDMMSNAAMDRLVCGDVGYGKTEVAMRAAFKAVVDGGKQVAILVPTTVLAMQHYENFVERMGNFPVNIAVLSRFRTAKQTRETLEAVAAGTVDILIGTHRIISDDVKFKDLGLIIIDEEQRFGVKAKEHLKQIKMNVDCLTLSATPIPRTLYMSLIGVRDMSLINTPPQDRIPITTILTEHHDQTLKNALLRELARDGQAFVIHNRVETIYEAADRIKKLLPQARVAVCHGQMHADESDQVFHCFKNGQADILVATTIVENGIDIPNANTILIERADHFGMADLYQLRGRVGRWVRRAYAYFLVKNIQRLPEIARKRLSALAAASGYGGGMKVAMRDLEIRGAGNILGVEQSGNVSAIGFHLYCKLLKRAIRAFQGKGTATLTEPKVEFMVDARLPEDYVNETSLRMEIYQRLGDAVSWEEVDAIWEEIQDRFGSAPEPAQWLYYFSRVRVFAALHNFSLVKYDRVSLSVERTEKQKMVAKKFLTGPLKKPQDVETKVIVALQSWILMTS